LEGIKMAGDDDGESCPWRTVQRQFFADFMQFYFPAAHAEIDWDQPCEFLPGLEPKQNGAEAAEAADRPILQQLVRVALHAPASLDKRHCVLHVLLAWHPIAVGELMRLMQHTHCRLYFDNHEACAGMAVVAGSAEALPILTHPACLGSASGWFFPCVWFNDFIGQEAALRQDNNPFALLTLAHLCREATAHDMARRYREKWALTRSLFERDWPRERIILLFLALDWSLPLPPRWAQQLWHEIEQFEEQQIMRYVSSVERFIREREWQQGFAHGEANLLQQLLARRFGDLPIWVTMQLQAGSARDRLAWLNRALEAERLEQVFDETA
jgi:hypothetical protein